MTPPAQFFHRRSLTFATLALLISAFAASHGIAFSMRIHPPTAILILELLGVWCPRFSVLGGGRHPKGWTPNAANPSK